MRNIILFEDDRRKDFLPLNFTKPVAEFRIGILTISQKWAKWLNGTISYITADYLSEKFQIEISDDNYVINACLLPNPAIVQLIEELSLNEALLFKDKLLAVRLDRRQFDKLVNDEHIDDLKGTDLQGQDHVDLISHLWDIFQKNGEQIRSDFKLLTQGKHSESLSKTNTVIGNGDIFLEKGASVEAAILNTVAGPLYIGKNAQVMEGRMIRGPFSLGEQAVIKMGAKIYEDTSIGPYCKVGGEVSNSVIFGFSNKAHDGYLGNAVIGEWCNIGADTNNSNLKNNYAEVKLWNYQKERFELTGTQFCGLIMGDHTKVGINVMFNTGTVVGVCANIYGSGFPRNFIPSFSWGGANLYTTFALEKTFEVAEAVMNRRGKILGEEDRKILTHLFDESAKFRRWEKHH
jgi:UDP-N-acetylglucosamine diphosphorylase/glucosamine-1-phosphate N-acetyltransferase